MAALHHLYELYADRVAFFIVYIKEAHPEDGWVVTVNRHEGISVVDPMSQQERDDVARSCIVHSAVRIPTLVDSMDNAVARAYGGWPDRLYLIGGDGTITFQGGPGPFGFLPDQLEAAIEAELRAAATGRPE